MDWKNLDESRVQHSRELHRRLQQVTPAHMVSLKAIFELRIQKGYRAFQRESDKGFGDFPGFADRRP
jgi:hypothetical protein